MHKVSLVTDDELRVEFELGPAADDGTATPAYAHDNAASLMLAYVDVSRGKSIEQAYEDFRNTLIVRWNYPALTAAMTYMVVETCVKITQDLKKKHTTELNSKSSE